MQMTGSVSSSGEGLLTFNFDLYSPKASFKSHLASSATRAGALAGVGLALDPEGNKSVLIQPSSLEKKYFKFYIFLIF